MIGMGVIAGKFHNVYREIFALLIFREFCSVGKLISRNYCHATPFILHTWIIHENIFHKFLFHENLATQKFPGIRYFPMSDLMAK